MRQFNGHLQRLLREEAADESVFADVKAKTISYLKEYVDGVEGPQQRLAVAIDRLTEAGVATLFDRALRGANLAPVAGEDPAPAWIERRRQRWEALRAWFAPSDACVPRIEGLLDIARSAIIELLRVLERRWDNKRRSVSVANDFRRLAGWFAEASGDDKAQALFSAAFGLWPARHAHLLPLDGEERSASTGWAQASPVDVAPALRSSGTLSFRGRARRVEDPAATGRGGSACRPKRWPPTTTCGPRSPLPGGPPSPRLAGCRSRPSTNCSTCWLPVSTSPEAEDGSRRALSIDGSVEVVLWPSPDDRLFAIETDHGRFGGPDFGVSITLSAGSDGFASDLVTQPVEATGA